MSVAIAKVDDECIFRVSLKLSLLLKWAMGTAKFFRFDLKEITMPNFKAAK